MNLDDRDRRWLIVLLVCFIVVALALLLTEGKL